MKWSEAQRAVEKLRTDQRLYLPPLTKKRGFSSTRVEHLLAELAGRMEDREEYLEVGTLEGRTLEAAATSGRQCIGVDPCVKYETVPVFVERNITFLKKRWQELTPIDLPRPIGVVFYDGDHSPVETYNFLDRIAAYLADDAIAVIDDWDRPDVRAGVFGVIDNFPEWRLLREMPEYTQGPDFAPPNYVGYYYGVAVLGFRR